MYNGEAFEYIPTGNSILKECELYCMEARAMKRKKNPISYKRILLKQRLSPSVTTYTFSPYMCEN